MSKSKLGLITFYAVSYIVCPVVTFLVSLWTFLVTRSRISLLFIFLYLGLFGYVLNVVYDGDMDMMRLYNAYDNIKELSFSEAWPFILSVGDLSYTMFWLLGQLNVPTQFIGFLSSAWFYGAWFLVMLYIERFHQSRFSAKYMMAFFIIFITVTHPFFFSGIRSSTGTMIALIGTISLFQGKVKRGFYWLISSCVFHFSFIPYLLLCICFVFGNRRMVNVLSILLVLGTLLYPYLMIVLSELCSYLGIVGQVISSKILSYSFEMTRKSAVLTYGSGWRFIDNVFLFFACSFIRFLPNVRKQIYSNDYLLRFDGFLTLFFFFFMFISSNNVMLGRYITILVYLNLLFVASLYFYFKKIVLSKYVFCMACFSMMFSCIAIYRELIGGDDINYVYYPRLMYQNLFSIISIQVDYGN